MLSGKKGSVLQDKLVPKCPLLEGTWSRGLRSWRRKKHWYYQGPSNLARVTGTHSPQSMRAVPGSCTSWARTSPVLGS